MRRDVQPHNRPRVTFPTQPATNPCWLCAILTSLPIVAAIVTVVVL